MSVGVRGLALGSKPLCLGTVLSLVLSQGSVSLNNLPKPLSVLFRPPVTALGVRASPCHHQQDAKNPSLSWALGQR